MSDLIWSGPETLRGLVVPIDTVQTHPENPRRGNVKVIGESLARFGQVRPIVVSDTTGYIVAGNHTYRAGVEERGWTGIAVVRVPLDADEERAYLLADNRTADLGTYDQAALLPILADLAKVGKLAGTGYTIDDYEDIVAEMDAVAETTRQEFGGGSETEERAARAEHGAGIVLKDITIQIEEPLFEQFAGWLKMLRKEHKTTGVSETIIMTVKAAAEAL